MNSERPVSEFAKMLPEMLESMGKVSFMPQGVSMHPTIKQGDSVTLKKPARLRKYDIILYTRDDGKAILHRIVQIQNGAYYVLCGDSQTVKEYGITDKNVIAKVVCLQKKDKTVKTEGFLFYLHSFLFIQKKNLKRIIKNMLIR